MRRYFLYKKFTKFVVLISIIFLGIWARPVEAGEKGLIVLCYHDVPKYVNLDDFGVDQRSFVDTIEFFRQHGYTFVGLDALISANRGETSLPEKSIMFTFDDGYSSFYNFVYPLLAEYRIQSTLAIVTKWIDEPAPKDVKHDLMTWDQIKEVANSQYVEVISHSHNLHKGVNYNPQGNEAAAATNRIYENQKGTYETEKQYRARIKKDLSKSKKLLEEKTDKGVRAIAWPYGQYNTLTVEEANGLGFTLGFALNDKRAMVEDLNRVERYLVFKNPTLKNLRTDLKLLPHRVEQKRIVQVDLDSLYDKDTNITERNLGLLLDRVKEMAVSTVYLQAFSDLDGNGNIKSVYFPNSVLPVKADLFNRVAHQLKTRGGVEVYAWMPMLSIVLPDKSQNDRLRVKEKKEGQVQLSSSWYHRLSPFSEETGKIMKMLYEDMAVHSFVDGVVFQDDGYLNDFEDFHPSAVEAYKKISGVDLLSKEDLSAEESQKWTQLKVAKLNDLTKELMAVVKKHRPEAKFARTLYAPILIQPESEEWFAQNYKESLALYDYVIIMAYPYLEEVKEGQHTKWLKELVGHTKQLNSGIEKTVFKIQSFDWKKDQWIDAKQLDRWLKTLITEGAYHVGYYPDDFIKNRPDANVIRMMMSKEDFPYKRKWK